MTGILENKKLSWKAKGLLIYLLSIQDKGDIFKKDVVKISKDGYDSMNSGFTELLNEKYIFEMPYHKGTDGKFIGIGLTIKSMCHENS